MSLYLPRINGRIFQPAQPRLIIPAPLWEFAANVGRFSDAGTTPATDGGTVQQWNDRGPGAYHASQGTANRRPTLVSSGSPNYLEFTGATSPDNFEFGGSTVFAATGSPWTFEAWVRLANFTTTIYPHLATIKTNTTDAFDIGFSNAAGYLGLHFGSATTWARLKTDTSAASLTGADKHVVITYNGAGAGTGGNFTAGIDGVLQTLSAASAFGATTNTASCIGAILGGNNPFTGRIYFEKMYRFAMTAGQIAARYAAGIPT